MIIFFLHTATAVFSKLVFITPMGKQALIIKNDVQPEIDISIAKIYLSVHVNLYAISALWTNLVDRKIATPPYMFGNLYESSDSLEE